MAGAVSSCSANVPKNPSLLDTWVVSDVCLDKLCTDLYWDRTPVMRIDDLKTDHLYKGIHPNLFSHTPYEHRKILLNWGDTILMGTRSSSSSGLCIVLTKLVSLSLWNTMWFAFIDRRALLFVELKWIFVLHLPKARTSVCPLPGVSSASFRLSWWFSFQASHLHPMPWWWSGENQQDCCA